MVKRYCLILIISVALPLGARAEEVNLGNFSVDAVRNIVDRPIFLHFGGEKFAVEKNSLLDWLKIRPSLAFRKNYSSEAENLNYFPTTDKKLQIYFRFITSDIERYHTKISTSLSINEDKLRDYLETAKNETRVEPQNARLAFAEGRASAFSVSKNGLEINPAESSAKIKDALKGEPLAKDIEIAANILKPDVSSSDVEQYGIKELIGEGVSNFRGSPKNRIHNVTVGASKFNGVIIKPGEEFSFIKTLGPVDASTGYLPELVIKTDKTVPEFGGGMCQVSTTMFRAALNTGLKITARTNHAYPVQYYAPQGLDATVYIPKPDLMFVNDTPGHILVQTRIEGTQLLFDFFGTSDGRQTKIVGPFVTERGEKGAMKTTVTQEVYDSSGKLIRSQEFKSNYKSPSLFPHPGEEKITEKPSDWSSKEWKAYKKANGL